MELELKLTSVSLCNVACGLWIKSIINQAKVCANASKEMVF